jgi:hypothetical protein
LRGQEQIWTTLRDYKSSNREGIDRKDEIKIGKSKLAGKNK